MSCSKRIIRKYYVITRNTFTFYPSGKFLTRIFVWKNKARQCDRLLRWNPTPQQAPDWKTKLQLFNSFFNKIDLNRNFSCFIFAPRSDVRNFWRMQTLQNLANKIYHFDTGAEVSNFARIFFCRENRLFLLYNSKVTFLRLKTKIGKLSTFQRIGNLWQVNLELKGTIGDLNYSSRTFALFFQMTPTHC